MSESLTAAFEHAVHAHFSFLTEYAFTIHQRGPYKFEFLGQPCSFAVWLDWPYLVVSMKPPALVSMQSPKELGLALILECSLGKQYLLRVLKHGEDIAEEARRQAHLIRDNYSLITGNVIRDWVKISLCVDRLTRHVSFAEESGESEGKIGKIGK